MLHGMVGSFTTSLTVDQDRRVGDIVALIDAA